MWVAEIFKHIEKVQKVVLYFSTDKQKWFPAINTGLGFRDLLLILSYAIIIDNDIVLLEEPENHLYPEIQRKLLKYLKEETDKQYFITTHSNVFLDNVLVDRIFHTTFNNKIIVSDRTEKALILSDLGYLTSDNLNADILLLVEGKTDVGVFEEFLIKLGVYAQYNIKILCGGGTNMTNIDYSVFKTNFYKTFVIIDGDPESVRLKLRIEQPCITNGLEFCQLRGYGIENYFSIRALSEIYDPTKIKVREIDYRIPVNDQQIDSYCKDWNYQVAQKMTIAEIQNTNDLYNLLDKICRTCENIPVK